MSTQEKVSSHKNKKGDKTLTIEQIITKGHTIVSLIYPLHAHVTIYRPNIPIFMGTFIHSPFLEAKK